MSCCNVPPKCTPKPRGGIFPFHGFTEFTSEIPKLYWNVRSQEQRIHAICDLIDKLICYADYLGDNLGITREELEELKSEFEEFKAHGFDEYYEEQLHQWILDHMPDIIREAIKMVWFGLTLDGYFVAYIPDAWEDIIFDTGANYNLDSYGRLILYYEVDTSHDVWQDISNAIAPGREYQQIVNEIDDLERRVSDTETTLYTPIEGD